MAEQSENNKIKKPRLRSPNHPYLSLPDALKRAEQILEHEGSHEIPVAVAHERWGYKRYASIADQSVAALKAYGLLDVEGNAKKRRVKVTERARRIIKNAPDRQELLQKAALEPDIHKEMWDRSKSNGGLPSDETLREYLLWEREDGTFNENAVDAFIEHMKATFRLAKVIDDDIMDRESDNEADESREEMTALVAEDPETSESMDEEHHPKRVKQVIRDFPIPLMSGGIAVVKVPFPMSKEDFDQLQATLTAWEKALTRDT